MGGGKGGVGKTFLTANLAVAFARVGRRTLAVDTDLEGPNLHTWLGVPAPRASLADFVAGRESDPAKLSVQTPVPSLGLLAATGAHLGAAQPEAARRRELLRALARLPCEVVMLDCGAGAHPATVDYFLACEDGLLVLHPEPTAVENTYAFLRAAFYRRMELALQKHDVRHRVREAMEQRGPRGIRTPHDLLREVRAMDPQEGERFVETMQRFRPRLVVNEVATADDVRLGFAVRAVCRKFFGLDAEYVGYVNRDAAVRRAVQQRRSLLEVAPRSDAAVYVERIARKLLAAPARTGAWRTREDRA